MSSQYTGIIDASVLYYLVDIGMTFFPNARACLEASAERYASLSSYADVGVVENVSTPGRASCWFSTKFEAPNRYRFEFATSHPFWPLRHVTTMNILGSDGERNYYLRKFPRSEATIKFDPSLLSVISSAAGVSQGTATTIGKLLFPDLRRFPLVAMARPRFRANREIGGTECLSISGIWPGRGRFTVWLGMHDLLLRRLLCHEFHRAETRSQITTNQAIPSEAFHPPSAETYHSVELTNFSKLHLERS